MKMRTIRFGLLVVLAWTVGVGQVVPTTAWTDFYSDGSTVNGSPLPIGAVVRAYDPQGVLCGEFIVHTAGSYGYLHVYGDDASTPGNDEGAVEGDTITFTIQGVEALGKGIWTSGTPGQIVLLHLHVSLPPPEAPSLVLPASNALGVARPVELHWTYPVSEVPGIGQTTSRIQVATDNLFTAIVVDSSGVYADSLILEGLSGGGEYFWRVRVHNSVTGTGPYADGRSFTTTVTAVIDLSQSMVDLGERAVGDTVSQRLYLHNPSTESVIVSEIRTLTPHFSATPISGVMAAGDSLGIDVFYHPHQFGTHLDSLAVLSNASTNMLYADLTGRSPRPVLEVSPQAIDFGTAASGSADIRFVSTSINDARIDTIYTGTRYYGLELPSFPRVVSRSETLRVQIYFSPDSVRDFPDTLYVVDNTERDGGSARGRVALTGRGTQVTGIGLSDVVPGEFRVGQNYPNPFNPTTQISFDLPVESRVAVTVYSILGQKIATVLEDITPTGTHTVTFDGRFVPSGLYLYTVTAVAVQSGGGQFTATKRMILLK